MSEPPDNISVKVVPQSNNPVIEVAESDPVILTIHDKIEIMKDDTEKIPLKYRAKHPVNISWQWSKNFGTYNRHHLGGGFSCMNVASTSITVRLATAKDNGFYYLTVTDAITNKTAVTSFELTVDTGWCTIV